MRHFCYLLFLIPAACTSTARLDTPPACNAVKAAEVLAIERAQQPSLSNGPVVPGATGIAHHESDPPDWFYIGFRAAPSREPNSSVILVKGTAPAAPEISPFELPNLKWQPIACGRAT